MTAALIDDERLVFQLLRRDLPPGVMVAAELDVEAWDELPFVTFITAGDSSGNGPGLWECSLTLNIFGEGEAAFALAQEVYQAVHSWDMPGVAVLPGIGSVEAVADVSKPSRTASVSIGGKNTTQYSAIFRLALRN